MAKSAGATVVVAGREVTITHPVKAMFPPVDGRPAITKLVLVQYYCAVAEAALRGVAGRPMILKRFGQRHCARGGVPETRPGQPAGLDRRRRTHVRLTYASGTWAAEAVIHDGAGLAWVVNLGCVDLNPHPVRAGDLDHPDELRIDLDPMPGVPWGQVLDVAAVVREVLDDHGMVPSRRTGPSPRCGRRHRRSPARWNTGLPTRALPRNQSPCSL